MANLNTAFVFPGQGSQKQQMLESFAEEPKVQEIFKQASQVLGYDLWQVIQTDAEKLNKTSVTQPALLACSYALWLLFNQKHQNLPVKFFAGHSLGEYSALVCAEALNFTDGIKLVARRGELMQSAVPEGVGGMAAILGLDNDIIAKLCEEHANNEVAQPANFNSIGQTVIAGHKDAVARVITAAKTAGAKRAIMLEVSVPSHCALMQDVAKEFSKDLESTEFRSPLVPILHNIDSSIHNHPDDLRLALIKQLYSPVQWVDSINRLVEENVNLIVECGPGSVLSGLIKRIDKTIKCLNIDTSEKLDTAVEQLQLSAIETS